MSSPTQNLSKNTGRYVENTNTKSSFFHSSYKINNYYLIIFPRRPILDLKFPLMNIKIISETPLIYKSALENVSSNTHSQPTCANSTWQFFGIRARYGLYGFCPALNTESSLEIRAKIDLNCLENCACNLTRFLFLYGMQ